MIPALKLVNIPVPKLKIAHIFHSYKLDLCDQHLNKQTNFLGGQQQRVAIRKSFNK
jgi:ABC-type phosphate/phosphonate transport system ATPase subunit